MQVSAFVPMRHNSERVPGKNYRPFNGKPLFHHTVCSLLECPQVNQVVVDTDSELIRDQCKTHFPDVRVEMRPHHLLGGEVPMTSILQYDAQFANTEWMLQTHSTSPLLRAATFSRAICTLESALGEYDSLFSVTRLQTRLYDHEGRPMNHDPSELLRTQDLPPVYQENSGLYIYNKHQIAQGRRFGSRPYLFEVDPLEATDIDEAHDFIIAELLAEAGIVER